VRRPYGCPRKDIASPVHHAHALGALVFSRGHNPVAGVSHDRWLLVHLHVAMLGGLAMPVLAVGRTLGPMLAVAPTEPVRRWPVAEVSLAVGVWISVVGALSQ
jgi:hypothetical protein